MLQAEGGIATASRLRGESAGQNTVAVWEVLLLLLAGGTAAALTMLVDWKLRIPGHAILRTVFPMTLGLALVPRRNAGLTMGAGALGTSALLLGLFPGRADFSLGSSTSLLLMGPLLDRAAAGCRPGWSVYLRLATAGLLCNSLAFGVRATGKLVGWEHVGGRPLTSWLGQAAWTYPLCGMAAGLISAVLLFRWSPESGSSGETANLD